MIIKKITIDASKLFDIFPSHMSDLFYIIYQDE